MVFTYLYPMPAVTVDSIIYRKNAEGNCEIVLINRKNEPFKDLWALPGGFIEMEEELEDAAKRELLGETGLLQNNLQQLFTVGTVGRDARQRTISVFYIGAYEPKNNVLQAGDDASQVEWFTINDLPPLAFDHNKIIHKAFAEFIKNNI